MKKAMKIFQYISLSIAAILIVIFLIPNLFGIRTFIVVSGSMEPTIKTGSIAYINTNVNVKDIEEGDIICFNVDDVQVTHRVIKVNEDSFITKGDFNNQEDLAPVKFNNYIGRTNFYIPYVGYILSFFQSSIGVLIVSTVLVLNILIIIFEDSKKK